MRVRPVEHKFGKPKPFPVSFGIYKGCSKSSLGSYTWGAYKDYKIMIHNTMGTYNQKMIYVTGPGGWVKSKLIYIKDGIKKIIRSEKNDTSD